MATSQPQTRVLIIGAGLGGLALAQSLRKQNISFEIFERDTADGARAQGWAIGLHGWFMDDLLVATKDDMPDIQTVGVTSELGILSEAAVFDAIDLTERVRFGETVGHKFLRASRSKLRQWLLTHLNVEWGKRFVSYERDEDGVTAYFEDGSSARGDILVGADGVNSVVRRQLLAGSNIEPQHVPMGFIVGELDATQEQRKRWMAMANSFFIGYADQRRIFVGLKGINPDETARYYWLVGWVDKEAEKESFWTAKATQEELRDFVVNKQLHNVHPAFAEVMKATPVEGMLRPPLRLRDMTPPELPRGRVTLLGDSVHPMVPFRGEGGNMAMKDGFNLASILASASVRPVEDMLKDYESEMRERTTKSVLASRAGGDPERQ